MESSDGTAWDDEVRAWMEATVGPVTSGSATPDLEVFRDLTDAQEEELLDKIRAYRRPVSMPATAR
jgi:hypothetical protein